MVYLAMVAVCLVGFGLFGLIFWWFPGFRGFAWGWCDIPSWVILGGDLVWLVACGLLVFCILCFCMYRLFGLLILVVCFEVGGDGFWDAFGLGIYVVLSL